VAGNLTVANLFDTAMDAAETGLKATGFASAKPWDQLIPKLKKVVGTTFDATHRDALDDLRKAVREAGKKGTDEGTFLAAGGGVSAARGAGMAGTTEVKRCAAIKLLRHTYYHAKRWNHKMWIVSLPTAYSHWPDRHLVGTVAEMVAKLGENTEHFSSEERKHMSDATQRGLAWTLKAQVVLDDVKDKSKGLRLLKRWFADEDATDEQMRNFAATLKAGLKKIATKMSAGSLIVTDFTPIRHSADADDVGFAAANAFVWADKRDIVYIEKGFFTKDASAVFQKDSRHWARVMVHEMAHREGKTDDVRYGWKGVRPVKGTFSSAQAMSNADSWALFVADAAGAMTKTDLARALGGTVGAG
jgi:hypothetical protein